MEIAFAAVYFVFGTIVGSYLNVVVLRYYLRSSLKGRSFCFSCGKHLKWHELVPLFSYLFLRGHCSGCKSAISPQYFLVELLTGVLFAGLVLKSLSGAALVVPTITLSLLVAILVYDIRHKIVPDGLVYAFIALSFISLFISFETFSFMAPTWAAFFAGPVLFVPFFAMWFFQKENGWGLATESWFLELVGP